MRAPHTPAGSSDPAGRRSRRTRVLTVAAAVTLGPLTAFVALAVLGPALFPYRTYVVRTGSMEPAIGVGALAVYRPVQAGKLAVGDVIAFTRPGSGGDVVTHRIDGIEGEGADRTFVTKGDANREPDDWRIPAQGQGWRYVFSIPKAGYGLAALGSPGTRRAAVVIAVVVGAGAALVRIWRSEDHDADPTATPATPTPAGPADPPADPAADPAVADADVLPEAARQTLADCMSVVLGHTQLLRQSMAGWDPRRDDLDAITAAAERAAAALTAVTPRTGTPRSAPSAASGTRRPPTGTSAAPAARAR